MKIVFCELAGRTGHDARRQLLSEAYWAETGEDLPEIRITDRENPISRKVTGIFYIPHTETRVLCAEQKQCGH